MEPKNLWGDLTGITGFKTPAIILREQASFLSQFTGNLVYASVIQSVDEVDHVIVNLYLKSSKLDKYTNNVLRVQHSITGYPVKIADLLAGKGYETKNEEEFISVLAVILSSKEMKELIGALMSYSGITKIEKKADGK